MYLCKTTVILKYKIQNVHKKITSHGSALSLLGQNRHEHETTRDRQIIQIYKYKVIENRKKKKCKMNKSKNTSLYPVSMNTTKIAPKKTHQNKKRKKHFRRKIGVNYRTILSYV